jgi:hypothetical protein
VITLVVSGQLASFVSYGLSELLSSWATVAVWVRFMLVALLLVLVLAKLLLWLQFILLKS